MTCGPSFISRGHIPYLQPNGESSRLHVSHCRLGALRIGRIYQYGNASGRGHQSIEHVADIEDYDITPAPRGRRSERFQYVPLTLYFAVGRPELQGVVKDHRDQQRDPSNQYVAENGHGE
jgi:hypothetical protein